ncbi:MAG TPA: hypothetical protein VJ787_08190, partial [Thermoleophilia bacterium]|nr:hypothetical protein [Thermoleophilia bacterium]
SSSSCCRRAVGPGRGRREAPCYPWTPGGLRPTARGDHRRHRRPAGDASYCQDAGACLMLSSMLHCIATGNLLPAAARIVCVDINSAVVTKLDDRGSFQIIGIVTDVGLFLEQFVNEL